MRRRPVEYEDAWYRDPGANERLRQRLEHMKDNWVGNSAQSRAFSIGLVKDDIIEL